MSHLNPGLISAYNSLTDKHLAGYFSNTRIRRHLQRAGLITRSGRIVPDKEYRHKLIQRAHQRHVRECLAQAIFHKVLEMERVHQIEIKRRLEEFARRERVHKIKVERSKRYEEDIIRILSPRPPTGARCIRKQHSGPEGEHSESSESPSSSRPNTAPGKMQRPVRLKPIHSNSTTASLRRSSPYRLLESSNENDQTFNCTVEKESRRRLTTMEAPRGISPYCLPVINNFVTPVPPATKRKERGVKVTPSGTLRGRRLRPTTASSGADVSEDPPMLRSSVHQSRVGVNMVYFGKTVHLSHDQTDMRDDVKVFQQHCGGENLCVYKGKLREGETFQFISRRHRGFPFSLTFFLNGLQVERLSSCCEFKHRKGSRLGGKHGHFGFSSVEGASPCYKCIIAMGLDKKPTPPPKRVKEDGGRRESAISLKDAPEMRAERTVEDAESVTSPPQDMETQVKEETAAEEDHVRDDYEEDFEADDEGPAEEKKSPSPTGETESQVKDKDDSETEDDGKDEDIKSRSGSSCSGSDREESDAEATKDSREDEKPEQAEEVNQEETAVPPDEKDESHPEEAAATEAKSAAPKDSDVQNSAGESTEIDISDTSVPSGNENKQSDDTSEDKEVEKTVDEIKQEEEQERAKSVQEKLAEAILKESQCSSEPELSDTSTEEEEESTHKGSEQDNKDAVPEEVTFTEQQATISEETKREEDGVGDVALDQETSEPKEQEGEQDPHENNDERVKIDEEDEKAASEADKNTTESDKPEDTEDTNAPLHPEEETAEDDKTSEPQEDAEAKSADAAEKGEETEEKTAGEADAQPDETGQGAKSSEEDESSVSEPNKKTDETAVLDNAEAGAMTATETMEMKAELSEEREALSCEEAPVTDAEKQGDSDDRAAASETEVTPGNSSSSLGDSGDTTVEKTADISEDNAKDESNKDDIKEEEAEEVSAAEATSKDDSQQETGDLGEEQTEKSVAVDDEVEEEGKEEDKQTNPDEITEGCENSEESQADGNDKTEDKENNDTEEKTENEENISELTKNDLNTEGKPNEEQPEKEDKGAIEEQADESEKTEKDEGSECVKNENDVEESEEKGVAADRTSVGEKVSEAAAEEAENEEKDQSENRPEQSEAVKDEDDEESEEKKADKTTEGEETEIEEAPEKSADEDNVKISDENKSEDVIDNEAASVADETKMPEETLNNATEAEDVKNETERGSDSSEKGEIDAENGEVSPGAENKTQDDELEAQAEGENEMKTAERTEDERKMEEPAEDDTTGVKAGAVESGDGHDEVDEAPDTDVVESEAKEGDDNVEKQDESTKNNSEPETSGREIKEESKPDERKDNEETKQDENCNISDPDREDRDSHLTKKNDNVQGNVSEVIVASSGDQAESSPPIAVDLDDAAHKSHDSTALSDSKSDKHPPADENAAADGENGDTEEASKASEEGASVLLKPQAQSSLLTEQNKADNMEESLAVGKETPEDLVRADSADLVTNWVTMHQTSKFFETFVEPLEDLTELTPDAQVPDPNEEVTQSTELSRPASPLKMVKTSENAEQDHTAKDVNESGDKTKEEDSDHESNHPEDGEPCEKDPAKEAVQVEETEVTDFLPKTESEQNDKESVAGQDMRSEERRGSRRSLEEDKVQELSMADNTEPTDICKTEVGSIVTSGRPESVSEEKTTVNGPDLSEEQTPVEEVKDLLPSLKTEEHREPSMSPEGVSKLNANDSEDTEENWEKSREVTDITDFTASKSEDGSLEESHHREIQPKASGASVNGDRRDAQLIQDIARTLSKDRLSTFSVDENLFGRSSYPLLTAARTESGH